MLEEIIKAAKRYLGKGDTEQLAKAFEFAEKAHAGQKRLSGEDFITHPKEVALILLELRQDVETVCAALLHDVLEDTKITYAELKKEFSDDIAFLVEGVTKLTELKFSSHEEMHAENVRKMLLAMAEDIRIVFIKLADRLHNMRTLESLVKDHQKQVARETMDIYAPLAHRLGLGLIKWELEDLAFRYLDPQAFQEIKKKIAQKRKEREKYINEFTKEVKKLLKTNDIKGEIYGRPKHFYSIYSKMKAQNLSFDEIYDLLAMRIVVNTEQECYTVLGNLHARWKPIQGKIKDYIAMPKANMYQSLHTTVIGPEGRQIEIQIRTSDMHHIAEYGIASHWVYKETDKTKVSKKQLKEKDKKYLEKITWLRKITEEKTQGKEFIDNLKTDLVFDEVYVFSPKGDVYSLPKGSTPVDFAYQVHTEVGHRCTGAKINNKIVPLDSELQNGDIVEILTRKEAQPHGDWLSFVKTPRTKAKIKAWLSKQNSQQHLENGKENLYKSLREFLLEPAEILKDDYLKTILKKYSCPSAEELYITIGHGDLAARAVARMFLELYQKENQLKEIKNLNQFTPRPTLKKKKINDLGITAAGGDTIMMRLANCCCPLPGDNIIGFVTMGYGITVHRASCRNVKELQERKIEVFWQNTPAHKYPSVIIVEGFDRVGIFKDILNVIADQDTNVLAASAKKRKNSEIRARITVEVTDLQHLMTISAAIKKVKDVYAVYRQKS